MILDMVGHACSHFHVGDRGHKSHSQGLSCVEFYISHGRPRVGLNPGAVAFEPNDGSGTVLATDGLN